MIPKHTLNHRRIGHDLSIGRTLMLFVRGFVTHVPYAEVKRMPENLDGESVQFQSPAQVSASKEKPGSG